MLNVEYENKLLFLTAWVHYDSIWFTIASYKCSVSSYRLAFDDSVDSSDILDAVTQSLLQGNKGGVSARMDLYNTSVCFVNCHLAAHVEEYERRNEDYDGICDKSFFEFPDGNRKGINDHE